MEVPAIRYAKAGEVHVAYQSFGRGMPLVGVPPFAQNIELLWGDPTGLYPHFLHRFGSFSRLTHFDKRGTGLSDRVPGFVSLQERMEDLRAVMDAAGIERATIGGISEGGPLALLFAATYPERVDALVLIATSARFMRDDAGGYPYGSTPEELGFFVDMLVDGWATPDSVTVQAFMPSLASDAQFLKWMESYERGCASPGAVREVFRFVATIDVRDILATIRVPTLVIHRTDDLIVPVSQGRYLADHIAGARFVELAGNDHVPWVGGADEILDITEEFLTGVRPTRSHTDRVLATVLFTDIVGSTEHASRLGDAGWRDLLDRHDRTVRREVEHEAGRVVKTTGDGVLAVFDSPSGAVRAALALIPAIRDLGIDIRVGLHTGEIERRGDDVAGVAVHVAARVQSLAPSGGILTTTTVRDLVLGSPFTFRPEGTHSLKGVPGEWHILTVE